MNFSRPFSTNCPNSVLFSIVWRCGLCLLCFGSAANADVTPSDLQPIITGVDSISSDTHSIYLNTRYIQSTLDTLNHTQSTQSDYQRKLLLSLTGQVDGYPPVGYTPIATLLERIAANTSSASDVLAGNPWWSTNSSFVLSWSGWSPDHPRPSQGSANTGSFPDLLSVMLSSRSRASADISGRNWYDLFGGAVPGNYPDLSVYNVEWGGVYSYEDFVADAFKSNWFVYASIARQLHGISNALGSASTPSAEDVLAGNPWWATNSEFSWSWSAFDPKPIARSGWSFPEAFSIFLASRIRDSADFRHVWNSFGYGSDNTSEGLYTFEDWLADAVRSNLVLTTSATYSNLVEEVEDNGYDTSPSMPTNSLPEYFLPEERDFSAARSQLAQGEQATEDLIANIPKPSTGGNSEIVLIPDFTVGGIHVREYRASLNSSIVPVCRGVLTFLYGVGVACYLFSLAKTEYIFYASLGRAWGYH